MVQRIELKMKYQYESLRIENDNKWTARNSNMDFDMLQSRHAVVFVAFFMNMTFFVSWVSQNSDWKIYFLWTYEIHIQPKMNSQHWLNTHANTRTF